MKRIAQFRVVGHWNPLGIRLRMKLLKTKHIMFTQFLQSIIYHISVVSNNNMSQLRLRGFWRYFQINPRKCVRLIEQNNFDYKLAHRLYEYAETLYPSMSSFGRNIFIQHADHLWMKESHEFLLI